MDDSISDSTVSLSDSDETSNSDVEITDFSESSSDITDVSAAALSSDSSASSIFGNTVSESESSTDTDQGIFGNTVSESESSTDTDQGIFGNTISESESSTDTDQEHPSVGLNIIVDEESDSDDNSEYSISSDSGYSKEDIERNTVSYKYQVDTKSSLTGVTDKCSICLSAFVNQSDVRRLPCFHLFHTACIDEWLQDNKLCPNCLMDIKTKECKN